MEVHLESDVTKYGFLLNSTIASFRLHQCNQAHSMFLSSMMKIIRSNILIRLLYDRDVRVLMCFRIWFWAFWGGLG